MSEREYSVIFLPTLGCDACCDYCFEDKSVGRMALDRWAALLDALLDFADTRHVKLLHVYWQGGEVLTLTPEWVEQAQEVMRQKTASRDCTIANYIQSNLLAYDDRWNPLIAGMFGNSVGTSMDFPNRHRRMPGGHPEEYTERWMRNVRRAMDAGIRIGVIAVPSAETLQLGAEAFYSFFTEQVGVTDFQVNSPFPGGQSNTVQRDLPLDARRYGAFLVNLTDVWLERGYRQGVALRPSIELLNHYLGRGCQLPCFWQDNCSNGFVCVDPEGNVSQCDCWAASYPGMRFGNIFGDLTLASILEQSSARGEFMDRPGRLVESSDCLECEHLSLCHGGCPVRAFSTYGRLDAKDPYCESYKMLFEHLKGVAVRVAESKCDRRPEQLRGSSPARRTPDRSASEQCCKGAKL
jgi:radical SAM protein with 4Fe4S-binding SPASM domain